MAFWLAMSFSGAGRGWISKTVTMRMRNLGLVASAATVFVLVMTVSQVTASAQTQRPELLLPFSAGLLEIQADETYDGDTDHPSIGPIAFDFTDVRRSVDSEILAMGDGRVRVECVHFSGSAVLEFQADGYAGSFFFVHLDANTFPPALSGEWTRVEQGEVLGELYPDALSSDPEDECAQFSTGAHLHLDFPENNMVIDGITFNEDSPNDGAQVSSTNRKPGERDAAACSGLVATIVGTSGDDVLQGTPGPDVIAGLQGDDVILGAAGDDVICGGIGDDFLVGNDGFDVIFGAQGDDTIVAAGGASGTRLNDAVGGGRFFGGQGDDTIFGSNRWDRAQGGPGNDRIQGFDGRDWIRGGPGEDFLEGGNNVDDLHGGNGNDIIATGGGDIVAGGAGARDTCRYINEPASIRGCEVFIQP